jgi:hypothetical protein
MIKARQQYLRQEPYSILSDSITSAITVIRDKTSQSDDLPGYERHAIEETIDDLSLQRNAIRQQIANDFPCKIREN